MYLVHFGRSPATTATATATATVPVVQARRRAVPSIGTEASESCNLPRALSLGAAAFSHFSNIKFSKFRLIAFSNFFEFANLLLHKWSKLWFFRFFYTEFHFVSLAFACRVSVSRCLHHHRTLFSSSCCRRCRCRCRCVVVSLFRCLIVSLFRCCRVFRCHWPSSCPRSVEHGQRQWSSPRSSNHCRDIQDLRSI